MTHVDITTGRITNLPPGLLHTNITFDDTQMFAVAHPMRAVELTAPYPTSEPFRTFRLPPRTSLWTDGDIVHVDSAEYVRRIHLRAPGHAARVAVPASPPSPPSTPEEHPMATTPTQVSSIEDAQTAFTAFQDALAREAERNGYVEQFRKLMDAAARELPSVQSTGPEATNDVTASITLSIPVSVPGGDARDNYTTRDLILREVTRWAADNGHGAESSGAQAVAWLIAHQDRIRPNVRNDYTGFSVERYSIGRDTTSQLQRRVQFVTTPAEGTATE